MSGKGFWNKWKAWTEGPDKEPSDEEKFLEELRQAHQDWILAQQRIDLLSDPDLIDHAIYVLEAAEKKYSFYLRKAREKGIRIDIPYPKAM
ncbi:YaaL family protein [Effusibacillus pohliae]|uniref:YaaL family protein n=1 Tax=Effusibacillus pohliae TaxID=232270 RepID=UPI00037C9EE3|nr:YaaL family protein [Effusibacillus pohliae]